MSALLRTPQRPSLSNRTTNLPSGENGLPYGGLGAATVLTLRVARSTTCVLPLSSGR